MKDAALLLASVLFPLTGAWAALAWAAVNIKRLDHDRDMFDRRIEAVHEEEARMKRERAEVEQQRKRAT